MANDFSKIKIGGTTYNVKTPNKLTVGSKTFDGSSAVTIAASDLGLSNALHFIGETTTELSDGSNTSSISVGGNTHTAASGDVVLYGAKEFVWQGSMWKELGDGSSHALKTVTISAGGGLTGGGDISTNRTISHADTSSQESVSAGEREYIKSVTLDGYGHVTGLTTGTEQDISGKQDKLTAGSNISISGNTISATVPTNYVTTDTEQTITSKKTFNGEVKFGNTENFQGYYIKRMIGSLGAGTAYANIDSSYKDGTWHRMWRLRFPSGSSFWGKIKITLYGGYSSFNASGVMSKSITCNFNTSNIYNNVGCYDGLGVNVEQDFRISEAIWNATASAWEVLIWQKNLNGNNSPTIMLECWTTNNTNYINAFNGIAAQTVELTQSTSYSAQRASSTGGTKTVEWTTLPVYENPLGEEIATMSDLSKIPTVNNGTLTIQKNGTDVQTFTANQSGNVTANITVPTKTSQLTNDSGFTTNTGTITGIKMNGSSKGTSGVVDLGTVITAHQDISGKANLEGGNTFTGKQTLNSPASDGYSINASGYIKGSWLQSSAISNKGSNTGKVCVFDDSGWIYYRTPAEILTEAGGATTSEILPKTTYEWNKEFAAGSNGAISLGRYNIYDTQITFDIDSTTSTSMSGKLVIATQNGQILQAKVFGDATGALASRLVIYQSAITNNRSWIEVFCNFNGWSKNKVHIYGVALNSSTVQNQMSSVTFTNGVPSPITSGDTKWNGTIINDLSVKANLSGGNTFSGQQIFQNSNSGAVAECVMNNSAWDSFTVRNTSDNTQKTAISSGYVWCQDSDAIYSRFNATSIYYGNDNNGSDCTLLFPEIASGESLEKTIATTDQIHTYGAWTSGTSGTIKLPSAGTYQVRYGNGYTSVLWWDGKTPAISPHIRTNETGSYFRFIVSIYGVITLKEGKATDTKETDRTVTIYYRRIGD